MYSKGYSTCILFVCLSVNYYSHTTGYDAALWETLTASVLQPLQKQDGNFPEMAMFWAKEPISVTDQAQPIK